MRRRDLILGLGGAALILPLPARAQQRDQRRIGLLMSFSEADAEAQTYVAALREGLSQLGWNEGRNLAIDFRWAAGDTERMRAMASELVSLRPDAIVCQGTGPTAALHRATDTIPIVFVQVSDPIGGGFVASLSRPGGNMTGFSAFELSMAGKWLALLKEIVPRLTRVA